MGEGVEWVNFIEFYLHACSPLLVPLFKNLPSRWKTELLTFAELWPLSENKFIPGKSFEMKRFVNILCKSKDGGSILRPEILDEIELLNQYITQNISVTTYDGKYNLTYQDLCLSYDWVCGANEHIRMFREMTQVGKVIDLTFPKGGNKVIAIFSIYRVKDPSSSISICWDRMEEKQAPSLLQSESTIPRRTFTSTDMRDNCPRTIHPIGQFVPSSRERTPFLELISCSRPFLPLEKQEADV